MLRVGWVGVIRHNVLVDGVSIRRVEREFRVSRQVVGRYLNVAEPVQWESGPWARPLVERVATRIEMLLEEWARG
jgi:hypothetical protein